MPIQKPKSERCYNVMSCVTYKTCRCTWHIHYRQLISDWIVETNRWEIYFDVRTGLHRITSVSDHITPLISMTRASWSITVGYTYNTGSRGLGFRRPCLLCAGSSNVCSQMLLALTLTSWWCICNKQPLLLPILDELYSHFLWILRYL